ncbi:hypothetical protein TcarDRAFT_1281 [Thermosinus carboxydivorans Nor1]|uniref:Uncharacterized protein n=1 Tax=Thermosinus carboxydivorans Nor1 TaxID=401526 RepID=A1HR47_9FIRM|nr:hypothetical protein [Thermosinus carboxydivorans]EAX47546.1 hypothetical protein TcarDRAFT_1281 [Thermosinus carboxydivorans Nor1]
MDLKEQTLRKAVHRYLIAATQYMRALARYKNILAARDRADLERDRLLEVGKIYFAEHPEVRLHIEFVESGEYTQKSVDTVVENLIVKYIWDTDEVFQLNSPRCLERVEEVLYKFTSDFKF